MPKSAEGTVQIDPATGIQIYTGKITLSEPSIEQRKIGIISADDLINKLNTVLESVKITVWLVLDRLDAAFTESSQLECNALRSLFRVYLDIVSYSRISAKVFLRDDIWRAISVDGFREASHITRCLTISWNQQALLNLIVRRLVHNDAICTFYSLQKETVLQDAKLQQEIFYRIFPEQIDVGEKQPKTLEWLLSRIADGSDRRAPRELIHLLSASRDEQLKLYELGNAEPPLENLFDKQAIKAALPEVSKARYTQTLCAEYPTLKPYLDKLEGGKTLHTGDSLAQLWKTNHDKAVEMADKLTEIGFFRKESTTKYWVPFIYRGALNLVQGTA